MGDRVRADQGKRTPIRSCSSPRRRFSWPFPPGNRPFPQETGHFPPFRTILQTRWDASGQRALHEHQVQPATELEPDFMQAGHLDEAMSFMEADGAVVLAVDGADHDVEAGRRGPLDERLEERAPHSCS